MSSISVSSLVLGTLTMEVEGADASLSLSVLATAPASLTIELGTPGAQGDAATIAVGTTSTLAPGSSATVANVGTTSAAVFNFGIPAGQTGATGATGSQGPAGTAATIAAGTTTTGAPGTSASVTNVGSSSAAVFNFTIPRGDVGATGATGPAGPGVPIGGTDGQVLAKIDTTNYNTQWVTPFALQVRNQVRNETGAQLDKGTVVYVNGAAGNKVTVTKAQANTDATSAQTFAVLLENIPNNQNGYAVTSGLLENLDTSAYAAGTQVYLSPTVAGTFTSTKPSAPNHLVYVGVIERSHVNQGTMLVRIQNGYELDELHDVAIASKTNNDLLAYESSTNLWKNKSYSSLGLLTSATAASTYYLQTNPAGYIDATALAPYLTIASAAATYQTTAGMSAYLTTATAASTYLAKASNLSDLANTTTARTNLGLGTAAVEPATKLVPAGGTTGQVLSKASAADWDLAWATAGGGGGGGVDIQTFGSSTTSGTFTWTKPANAKLVTVFMWGAGGGGGSGACQPFSSARAGGGGGAGGSFTWFQIPASYLNATETVVVGAGGAGGAGVSTTSNGLVGTGGGNTTFKLWQAVGGGAGSGGTTTSGTAGTTRTSWVLISSSAGGTPGGGTTTNGTGGTSYNSYHVLPTGGGGGGGSTANIGADRLGGAGGSIFNASSTSGINVTLAGGNGATTSANATNGITTGLLIAGTGGGGGMYRPNNTLPARFTGANGGWPGGGGGGGGAADSGVATSGSGGAGANGYVYIQTTT